MMKNSFAVCKIDFSYISDYSEDFFFTGEAKIKERNERENKKKEMEKKEENRRREMKREVK